MDGADGRDGWSCYGAAGEGVRHAGIPAVWAPGQGVVAYPPGLGYRLPAEQDLVLQVHYSVGAAAGDAADASSVRFSTAATVEREAWFAAPDDFLLSWILEGYGFGESEVIPAGEEAFRYSFEYPGAAALADGGLDPASDTPFELVGVMPHMHELGRRQWLRVDPEGADTCAMEVREWDLHWQQMYFYETPVPLTAASALEITCEWDTSALTEDVLPGWSTDREMCLVTLMFATPAP